MSDYDALVKAIIQEDDKRGYYDPARWYHEHERQISLGMLTAPLYAGFESRAFAAWLAAHDADLLAARPVAQTVDREALVDFMDDWYDRNAGPGETWALSDLADALLASGVLDGRSGTAVTLHAYTDADLDLIRAETWDDTIDTARDHWADTRNFDIDNPYRQATQDMGPA